MKFLITNYASDSQTESMYINASINMIDGCKSALWNPKEVSAYDMFDAVRPDYFICHVDSISTDAMTYIKNESPQTRIILNTTGSNQNNVLGVENILLDEGIDIAFFFTNSDEITLKPKKTNILSILFGADIFLNEGFLNFNLDKAIFIHHKEDKGVVDGPHHVLSYNGNNRGIADIVLPIYQLGHLYENYNEIVIKYCGNIVPQLFFDAVYYGNIVSYNINNKDENNRVNEKLKKVLKLENNFETYDADYIKRIVKSKHTCLNRTKSLLSQLPAKEYIDKLDNIINNYTGEIVS